MLLMNGLVGDFTFAARLKGEAEPLSTLFYLPPNPNVVYSAALMSKAEETFLTGKSPYPIERTLLTTGLVEAGVRSLGTRPEAARNAAPGDPLPSTARIDVCQVVDRRRSTNCMGPFICCRRTGRKQSGERGMTTRPRRNGFYFES